MLDVVDVEVVVPDVVEDASGVVVPPPKPRAPIMLENEGGAPSVDVPVGGVASVLGGGGGGGPGGIWPKLGALDGAVDPLWVELLEPVVGGPPLPDVPVLLDDPVLPEELELLDEDPDGPPPGPP